MNIGLCKHSECVHSQECKRHIDTIGEEFNFKAICNESNNYQWLWKIETTISEPTQEQQS